ncbi:MAG: DUF3737 family protein [Anaeroplasma bactoclasticum]|nr:DUF3737 family protein [Anaeroplasma bactoclasticum]
MKEIKNERFGEERALYGITNTAVIDCRFEGIEDGESALKEANHIELRNCFMDLRYPLWHDDKVLLDNVTMTENCRAALWYTTNTEIMNSHLLGIKALRECSDISIKNTEIVSPEFGWRSRNIEANHIQVQSEYLFFEAKNLNLKNMQFKGKYSFQYVEDMVIEDSNLDTKDAFWHSKNVTVKNSILKGEYLAWYSENLTLINCKIIGTQPLCYCKNLKLIDCEMEATDLSFEYSDVEATVKGSIDSVKNPRSGFIEADEIKEVLLTEDAKYKPQAKIKLRVKVSS